MPDTAISALTEDTTPLQTDMLPILDVANTTTKKVSVANLCGVKDWDFTIVKSANQDVTNTTTLTSDTELTHTLTAGDTWLIEACINAQSNSFTAQYKFSFLFPAALGWATYIFCGSGSTVSNSQERLNNVTTFASALSIVGHSAFGAAEPFYVRMMLGIPVASTTGPCVLQFANVTAGAGLSSRTAIGSILRGKRLS